MSGIETAIFTRFTAIRNQVGKYILFQNKLENNDEASNI
jgi:hypothetical protein